MDSREVETRLTEQEAEIVELRAGNSKLAKLIDHGKDARLELENTLLKESLAVSNERYVKLKEQQALALLEMRQEFNSQLSVIRQETSSQRKSNEILAGAMNSELSRITNVIEEQTKTLVMSLAAKLSEAGTNAVSQVEKVTERYARLGRHRTVIDTLVAIGAILACGSIFGLYLLFRLRFHLVG